MAPSFAGRTAIVTGAAGGMGRATAMAFAQAGANVVVADVAVDGGEETVALIEKSSAGGAAAFVRTDVSDAAGVQAMVDAARTGFGGLDVAVNAAAIENETGPLADVEE